MEFNHQTDTILPSGNILNIGSIQLNTSTNTINATGGVQNNGVATVDLSSPQTLTNKSISGSQINSGTLGITVGISQGGTGQTTSDSAFNALVPSQAGNSGRYLTTNGTSVSWSTTSVVDTLLTGYVIGSNTVISETDSILVAFGKLQQQVTTNNLWTIVSGGIRSNNNVGINTDPASTAIFHTVDDTGRDWVNEQVGVAGSAFFQFRRALGTIETKTALTSGTKIYAFSGAAYDGTDYIDCVEIGGYATETHSPTAKGTEFRFSTTLNGTTTMTDRLIVRNNGNIDLLSSSPLVNATSYNGLVVTANTGTITTGVWSASPVGAIYGGTGQSSYVVGDLLYASSTTALSKLAGVATGNALISGGVGVAPSWGKVGLTTHVSGILPVANGGSGTSTVFTQGNVVFAGTSGVYTQDSNLFWDNTLKSLTVGPTGTLLTNNPFSVNGNVNSFLQFNVQNLSAGTAASSDIIATANTGNDTTGYIDLGIQNSGNTDPAFTLYNPLDGYLYVSGGNLFLGTDSAKDLVFHTNGTLVANERGRIKANGDFLFGTGALTTNATSGFFFIPQQAGVPTGVPTTYTGLKPITLDSTNNAVYFYNTSWRKLTENLTTIEVTGSDTAITTTSTSAVGSMTAIALSLTTPPAGTYLLYYSSDVSNSNNNAITTTEVYVGGTVVANTSRGSQSSGANARTVNSISGKLITVNGSQDVNIRWRVTAGTGSMRARNLTLLKVGY